MLASSTSSISSSSSLIIQRSQKFELGCCLKDDLLPLRQRHIPIFAIKVDRFSCQWWSRCLPCFSFRSSLANPSFCTWSMIAVLGRSPPYFVSLIQPSDQFPISPIERLHIVNSFIVFIGIIGALSIDSQCINNVVIVNPGL